MKRRLLLGLAAVVATGVAIAGAGAVGQHHFVVAPALDGFQEANFVSLCRFSHRAQDDPIVFPNKPGLSHDHSFFGNTTTSAASTPATLVTKQTTCDPTTDNAAYWAPTLIADGKYTEAIDAAVYYRRNTYAPVKAFPAGFMMIGGDSGTF